MEQTIRSSYVVGRLETAESSRVIYKIVWWGLVIISTATILAN